MTDIQAMIHALEPDTPGPVKVSERFRRKIAKALAAGTLAAADATPAAPVPEEVREVLRLLDIEICAHKMSDDTLGNRYEAVSKASKLIAALAREGAPDGWVVVPKEPTDEWADRFRGPSTASRAAARHIIKEVLAAAPTLGEVDG